MRAFARVDPDEALPDEHLSADRTVTVVGPSVFQEEDANDYSQNYHDALQALLDQDPRIAKGHAFSIQIIA